MHRGRARKPVEIFTRKHSQSSYQQLLLNCSPSQINSIVIPFSDGSLGEGQSIDIDATVASTAKEHILIGLQNKPSLPEASSILLQITLDFHQQKITRNSYRNGRWGFSEEYGTFPLSLGQKFRLTIEVKSSQFVAAVDGERIFSFPIRFPLNLAKYVTLEGQVSLDDVQIRSKYSMK